MKSLPTYCLFIFTLTLASVQAESSFPEVFNSEPDKTAEPPSPQEAVQTFQLPDGFRASVFASEPDVRNPIGMAWDWKGRLWVAENYTYAERGTRFEMGLKDRVLIFEDEDWDGVADSRKVFTEDVQMLTSVEVGHGGVWLMCPPQLLFIPDVDGDDVPDGEPIVKLDGFTVAQGNYHNFANGLRWGPDGWLYGRCGHSCPGNLGAPGTPEAERVPIEGGIWRYHPERGDIEVLTHGTTNPWGHDWDRHGELFFINTVNGHLWHGIAGAHFKESFGADPNPGVFTRLDMHADHWHYDRSGKWQESRDGAANKFGGGHAHIGMMIYQGDQWPETMRDRLYTLNMHGFRTNVERLDRHGSGYLGRHEDDVFMIGDPWFRGIDIQQGPDGAAYVLDWSDTGECHEHTGVHRTSGRIYRISNDDSQPVALASLDKLDDIEALVRHPNVWYERQLRQRLVDQGASAEQIATLKKIAGSSEVAAIRLRAVWALHALGEAPEEWTRGFLDSKDEHLRAWAIRLLTDDHTIDTILGPQEQAMPPAIAEGDLQRFVNLAQEDPSGLVRLTLASTLQRLPLEQRGELGLALASRVDDALDHNLPAMVWYGLIPLSESDPEALVEVARQSIWPDTLRWLSRSLALRVEEDPEPLNELLQVVAEAGPGQQLAMLGGVSDAFQGWRKAPKPEAWDRLTAALASTPDANLAKLTQELSALFGDGRAMDAIKELALDKEGDLTMRQSALATLIENRPPDLREICEQLLDQRGVNGLAARGLAGFDDPKIGEQLAKRYRRFPADDRPAILEVLVSRPEWSHALLKRIEAGDIPKSELSAFQARQIRGFEDEELTALLSQVWGEVRESAADKRKLVEEWTAKLQPADLEDAHLGQGRQMYTMICSACHVMYGQGGQIGPDLTGSNRANLDYLLENIFDPSAVVSADYQMTMLTLKDGRVLTGVVADENERTLKLRQAAVEMNVEKSEIQDRQVSPVSMMPEGLLLALSEEQVRDLIAYLMHPQQVPLPEAGGD